MTLPTCGDGRCRNGPATCAFRASIDLHAKRRGYDASRRRLGQFCSRVIGIPRIPDNAGLCLLELGAASPTELRGWRPSSGFLNASRFTDVQAAYRIGLDTSSSTGDAGILLGTRSGAARRPRWTVGARSKMTKPGLGTALNAPIAGQDGSSSKHAIDPRGRPQRLAHPGEDVHRPSADVRVTGQSATCSVLGEGFVSAPANR